MVITEPTTLGKEVIESQVILAPTPDTCEPIPNVDGVPLLLSYPVTPLTILALTLLCRLHLASASSPEHPATKAPAQAYVP